MKKVSKRDKFNMIKEALADRADIVEFCDAEIAALDRKAEKAKERAAKKRAEGDELKDVVFGVLTSEFRTAADITEQVMETGVETSASKVIYRLNALVKDNVAEKEDVTIETSEGKKMKRKAYRIK